MQIESGGDVNAIGDGGDAVGCMQIHMCVIKDVNRIYGTDYVSSDRYSKEKSFEIVELYLHAYTTNDTVEEACRVHNGGPRKIDTDDYWAKVVALEEWPVPTTYDIRIK